MMGLILGCIIGVLAKYNLASILSLGVNMAAVMVLIPKMTSLFMEGLMPISAAAKNFTQKKFKGRKFLIGLDAAVVVGNPDVNYNFLNRDSDDYFNGSRSSGQTVFFLLRIWLW